MHAFHPLVALLTLSLLAPQSPRAAVHVDNPPAPEPEPITITIPAEPLEFPAEPNSAHSTLADEALAEANAAAAQVESGSAASHARLPLPPKAAELKSRLLSAQGADAGFLTSRLADCRRILGDSIGTEALYREVATGEVPATSAVRCHAQLQYARLILRRKDEDHALREFQRLTNGEVPANALSATDAAMRVGILLSKKKDVDRAISVLTQLSEQSPFLDDAQYAKLLIAEYRWETGKRNYKPALRDDERPLEFRESIRVCDEILAVDGVRKEIRSIAELLRLENFYSLEEYDTALALTRDFITTWTPEDIEGLPEVTRGRTFSIEKWPKRHLLTAQTWYTMLLFFDRQFEETIASADEILGTRWTREDAFGNFNCRGYAMIYKAVSLEALGRDDEAKKVRADCAAQHPSWCSSVGASTQEHALKIIARRASDPSSAAPAQPN